MTARLPVPGGDDNTWGDILNTFLDVAHNSDGTLKTTAVSDALPSPIPTGKLGSGTASSNNFLRGDGVWAVPAGGSGGGGLQPANNLSDVADAGTSRVNLGISALTAAAACGNNLGGKYTAPGGGNGATFSPFSGYVDGQYVNAGDMVLLVNEATNSQTGSTATTATNGLWQVQTPGASGTWVRPTEFASGATIMGRSVVVMNGTANSGSWYLQAPTAGVVVDTDSQTWKSAGTTFTSVGQVQYSTSYGPGQIVVYNGQRVLITNSVTTGSGTNGLGTPFISASNYVQLSSLGVFYAADFGVVADGTTDNWSALQNLLILLRSKTTNSFAGYRVILPAGTILVSKTIILPTSTMLEGQGFYSTCIKLAANGNCDVIQTECYNSSSQAALLTTLQPTLTAGNLRNAFRSGLMDLTIHGNNSQQLPNAYYHCLNVTNNPTTSTGPGDPDFDPAHIFRNVQFRNASGDGYYHSGRSATRLVNCIAWFNSGNGFTSSFDTQYDHCQAGFSGIAGWYLAHAAIQAAGNKSYNNGDGVLQWTSGSSYTAGNRVVYNGVCYYAINAVSNDTTVPSSDTTNWGTIAATSPQAWGVGVYIDTATAGEITFNCDCQENSASSWYLKNCKSVHITGCSSNSNYDNAGTSGLRTTNPNNYAGVVLDGASGNVIDMACNQFNVANYPLRILNGATRNNISITTDNTNTYIFSPDSTVTGVTNSIIYNGSVIAPVGTSTAGATIISDKWDAPVGAIYATNANNGAATNSIIARICMGYVFNGTGTYPGWTLAGNGKLTTSPLASGGTETGAASKTILYNTNQPLASVSAPITISATGATDITLIIAASTVGTQWLPSAALGARLQLAGSTSTVSFVKVTANYQGSWTTLTSSTAAQTFTAGTNYTAQVSFNQLTGGLTLTIGGTSVLTYTLSSSDWTLFTTPTNANACGLAVMTATDDGSTQIGTFTAIAAPVSDGYGAAAAAIAGAATASGAPLMAIGSAVTTSGALTVNQVTPVNAASGALTMTLPTGQAAGSRINAYKSDSSTNTVTLSGSIRGSGTTTQVLSLQYQGMELEADSNGYWWPVSDQKTLASLDARYAQLSGATFTGAVAAPDFAPSGLTGATASSRYAGATTSGAPASGTFAKGDYVIDQTGTIWICTAAGSPGTWTQISGGGGGGVTATSTTTFTNKRITKRVATLTDAATVTPDTDNYDGGFLSTLSQATNFATPTGTPTEFQQYVIRITSATSRTISWGTGYRGSSALPLPTSTTGGGAVDYIGFQYDAVSSTWDLLAYVPGV